MTSLKLLPKKKKLAQVMSYFYPFLHTSISCMFLDDIMDISIKRILTIKVITNIKVLNHKFILLAASF
jgi:hypothetical protein